MRSWSYRDRWALVTGASAGLGEVFATRLAGRGMNLVLSARREDRLHELAGRLAEAHGVRVEVVALDLAEPGAATRLWDAASSGRDIHLLINNAGFGAQGRFDEVELARQREMVQLNCAAVLELAHHAIAAMRPRGEGGVVNVASLAGFLPIPYLATYAATKAFVLSLSQALWRENRSAGLRVLALCPGRTPTEFQAVAGTGAVRGAFGFRTPEQVVDAALSALERNRSYVVPGMENYLASWLVRILPDAPLTRLLKRAVRSASRRG